MSLISFVQSPPSLAVRLPSCTDCSCWVLNRLYSRSVEPRKKNWRLDGHVPPTSLVQDDTTPSLDLSEDEPPPRRREKPDTAPTPEQWRVHRLRIRELFPSGWAPTHKLSREAMDGLRSLHAFDKETFSTPVLAEKFRISPEAVRRILRSRWEPSREQRAKFADKERRSREEWVLRNRIEEKKRKLEILSDLKAAKEQEAEGNDDQFDIGVATGAY
ncbi:hypothetical protein F5I97DRAFT_1927223 [Phlebopus sp. FC_14]|nr:hypothetical protein F5I97DRAFT_1927223 [Phlebopus sp. FC_14]